MAWDLLFLIPVSLIGGISVFTDFKYGKIKNRLMLSGFIYTGLLYCGLFVYFLFLNPYKPTVDFLLKMLLNGGLAFGAGCLLWQFKLWAAGDAKLFSLYAFLTPLTYYSINYLDYFPSIMILLNTFCLIVVFLLGEFIFFSFKTLLKDGLNLGGFLKNKIKELGDNIKTYLGFISIFFIARIITDGLGRSFSQALILIFALSYILRAYSMKKLTSNKTVMRILTLLTITYGAYLMLNGHTDYLFNMIATSFVFMLFMGLLLKSVNLHFEKREVKKINANQLEKNMILVPADAAGLTKKLSKYKEMAGTIDLHSPDGLSREAIIVIKTLLAKEPLKEVRICRTFAFAPFMFMAFIITLIIKGSLVSLLIKFF